MNKNKYLHGYNVRRRSLVAGAAWPVRAWVDALRAQAKPLVVIGWLLLCADEVIE